MPDVFVETAQYASGLKAKTLNSIPDFVELWDSDFIFPPGIISGKR